MRCTKGLQQLAQHLSASVPQKEREFYERAMRARTRETAAESVARIHREEQQWLADERRWKREFEEWWAKRVFACRTAHTKRRLAMYRTNVMTLTREQWATIQRRYDYRCAYCHQHKPLTQDHIVPISQGGFHTHVNVIPACQPCNSKKGNRPAFKYRPRLIPF